MKNNKKGFTLIELLVVIAIIGALSALTVVSLDSARAKSRDAKRITDVRSIQNALEMYYASNATYPFYATCNAAGNTCDLTDGAVSKFKEYLPQLPADPSRSPSAYTYKIQDSGGGVGSSYTLNYELEQQMGDITTGQKTATPAGIK